VRNIGAIALPIGTGFPVISDAASTATAVMARSRLCFVVATLRRMPS
jgi:hypothetical protein